MIPRQVLFGNPEKSMARISTDGEYLSYLAPVEGVLNVWIAAVEDPDSARPITKDEERGIRYYDWTYDGQHILYYQDAKGDEAKKHPRDLRALSGRRARIRTTGKPLVVLRRR